jgi:dTDP-4-dehydrorhamnose 3,5-epimerase
VASANAVEVRDLRLLADARGWLMELVRADSDFLPKFGQVYVTVAYPGVVKGWHRHRLQTDALACASGMARVVTATAGYSGREQGTNWFDYTDTVVGPLAPKIVVVPPGVWHAFTPAGPEPCVIVNTVSEPYNHDEPDEERLPLGKIPFDWKGLDG